MGLLALGVLWLNTGLILAVAFSTLRNVVALRKRLSDAKDRGELVNGRVTTKRTLAVRRIRQLGRALTVRGPERIAFTDGAQSFEIFGGTISTDEGEITVAPAHSHESEVWLDPVQARERASACTANDFEPAYAEASKFKGFARDLELQIESGDRVWVYGAREDDTFMARTNQPLLVSLVDPIAYLNERARILVVFLCGAALSLFAVSVLALSTPHFGIASSIGGALGLAYFLAIQPIGTAVRDLVKTPARRMVGALWQRPGEVAAVAAHN